MKNSTVSKTTAGEWCLRKGQLAVAETEASAANDVADLEWRVKFAQMKLNQWREAQDDKWRFLKTWYESAQMELNQLQAA